MTIEFVGWALIHSVWQGAVIAALLAVALRVVRHATPPLRYGMAVAALAAAVVAPVATTAAHARSTHGAATDLAIDMAPSITSSYFIDARGQRVELPPPGGVPTPQVADIRPTTNRVEQALPWIVALWLVGLLVLSVRLIGGVVHARRLARTGVTPAHERIHAIARTLGTRLGISSAISILQSTRVDVPMVVGWVTPVILIPATMFTGLTPAQLEMLLAHELAHIRRYDTIVNLAQTVIETLCFYHPAVWWISECVRDERETCCDELAIAVTGNNRAAYGATLLALEELRGAAPALAAAASGGSLLRRIRRLATGEPADRDVGPRWFAGVLTTVAMLITAGSTLGLRPQTAVALETPIVAVPAIAAVAAIAPIPPITTIPAVAQVAPFVATPMAVSVPAIAVPQGRPNFSGTWTVLMDSSTAIVADRTGQRLTVIDGRLLEPSQQPPITVEWENAPIREVIARFAEFAGRTILPASGVTGTVSATIANQPWDVALRAIMNAKGYDIAALDNGTIVVDTFDALAARRARGGMTSSIGGTSLEVTIEQDDATLTLESSTVGLKGVYNLDGSERRTPVSTGSGTADVLTKARWDGDKLVLTTTAYVNNNLTVSVLTLSLDSTGNLIADEIVTPGRGGAPARHTVRLKKRG